MPKNDFTLKDVVDYTPALLREGKVWFIEFYCKDPADGKLKRRKYRVPPMKGVNNRRTFARGIIYNINTKLSKGWNPFLESADSSRSFKSIGEVLKLFLKDKRGLRYDTLRSYNSEIKFLTEYIENHLDLKMYTIKFNKDMALGYIDHVWRTREIGATRYNNILAFCKLLFNWMIEKRYIKENPFEPIKKKKQPPKSRIMDIDKKDRKKIREYLGKTNRPFYCISMFAFHSLLRPKEISYIRIGDIDLKKQVIRVRDSVAKNNHERYAPIPDVMIGLVKELLDSVHIARHNWYLFSTYGFRPGPHRRDQREIARYWGDLRNTLRIKKEVQFYSLRDAGIIQMLRDGRNPKEVMEAADHQSIEVTNKYVKVANKESNDNILKKSSAL